MVRTLISATRGLVEPIRMTQHWTCGVCVASPETFGHVCPSHVVVVTRSAKGCVAKAEAALAAAVQALETSGWVTQSGTARAAALLRVANLIKARAEPMARIDMLETGTPIAQSRGEVTGAAGRSFVVKPSEHTPSTMVMLADILTEAGTWSENIHTCLTFARQVKAGMIWTDPWMDDFPELTLGGMKQSGLGREIGSYGLDEFLEVKSLVMRIGRSRANWVRG